MSAARLARDQLLKDREEIAELVEYHQQQLKAQEADGRVKQMQTKSDLLAQIEAKREQQAMEAAKEERERLLQEKLEAAREEKHWAVAMDRLRL